MEFFFFFLAAFMDNLINQTHIFLIPQIYIFMKEQVDGGGNNGDDSFNSILLYEFCTFISFLFFYILLYEFVNM